MAQDARYRSFRYIGYVGGELPRKASLSDVEAWLAGKTLAATGKPLPSFRSQFHLKPTRRPHGSHHKPRHHSTQGVGSGYRSFVAEFNRKRGHVEPLRISEANAERALQSFELTPAPPESGTKTPMVRHHHRVTLHPKPRPVMADLARGRVITGAEYVPGDETTEPW